MAIHQEITFKASAPRIYEALTDAKQFAEHSGAAAEIDPRAGGLFSSFGGMITGQTIDHAGQ